MRGAAHVANASGTVEVGSSSVVDRVEVSRVRAPNWSDGAEPHCSGSLAVGAGEETPCIRAALSGGAY